MTTDIIFPSWSCDIPTCNANSSQGLSQQLSNLQNKTCSYETSLFNAGTLLQAGFNIKDSCKLLQQDWLPTGYWLHSHCVQSTPLNQLGSTIDLVQLCVDSGQADNKYLQNMASANRLQSVPTGYRLHSLYCTVLHLTQLQSAYLVYSTLC